MSIDPKKFLARATTGSAMSRIRKRKRALKRARAQVTVESAKVTGETIICAGMSPEREAEVRKQYYRDHEPAERMGSFVDDSDANRLAFENATDDRWIYDLSSADAGVLYMRRKRDGDHKGAGIVQDAISQRLIQRKRLGSSGYEYPALPCHGAPEPKEVAPASIVDGLTPEQIDKIRLDCLRAANTQLRGASPEEVVAAAAADLEARLRFLRGQS